MESMFLLVFLSVVCPSLSCSYMRRQTCTASSQCEGLRSCCRTVPGGNDVIPLHRATFPLLEPPAFMDAISPQPTDEPVIGVCGRRSARGERCIPGSCGCQPGLTCYSKQVGCNPCPPNPHRCYTHEEAERWRRNPPPMSMGGPAGDDGFGGPMPINL